MQWTLPAVLVAPLLAAALIGLRSFSQRQPDARAAGAIGGIGIGASLIAAVIALFDVARNGNQEFALVGDLALVASRPSAILLVLVGAVSVVVQSFARRSLEGDPRAPRFFALANALSAATMTVAIAANASLLVAAWLLTGIALAAMVGHHSGWAPADAASKGTLRAFLIGDVPLVLATIITIVMVGDLRLDAVDLGALSAERIDLGVGTISLLPVLAIALVIAGASRSALVPFHRWLPSTLSAPTPVSAMLHAGVVNGAGVLLIRFAPVYATSTIAMSIAFILGLVTAVWATAVMLIRSDVKGGLVYSTAGQMGFMTLQLAVGAFAAALFHIVGHAMYKAAMFLGAGGSVTATAKHRHLPHGTSTMSTPVRLGLAAVVPAAAMALAFTVIDTHLTAASTILVVLFGWMSAATALNGWLVAPPWSGASSVAAGAGASFVAVFGYIGGLTLFETFIADAVPYEVPAAVGPVWLAVALGVVALAAAILRFSNAEVIKQQRRYLYISLLGSGYHRVARPILSPNLLSQRTSQPRFRVASLSKG